MGEIADMMIDGTMDWETGEWNFDGEDGPGFPMTGAEAAAFKRGQTPASWAEPRMDDPALIRRREKRRRQRRNKALRLKAERTSVKTGAA